MFVTFRCLWQRALATGPRSVTPPNRATGGRNERRGRIPSTHRVLLARRGLSTAAVITIAAGLVLHLSINDVDYAKVAAGGLALLLASIGIPLSLRGRRFASAAICAACALGGLGMVAFSGILDGVLGPSVDDARELLARENELTDIEVTPLGNGAFEFTGRKGFDVCTGNLTLAGGFGSQTSDVSMSCGLPTDPEQLEAVCREGSAEACDESCEHLRLAEEVDWGRIAAIARRGCELGGASSCFYLGVTSERGDDADLAAALRAYDRACEGGSTTACHNAGLMHFNGRGCEADPAIAAERWQAGCEGGFARACEVLGESYRDGTGVEQDAQRARQLFESACEDGIGSGCNNLGSLYLQGHLGERDGPRSLPFFERGCDLGIVVGCRVAGELLEGNDGVQANPARAVTLLARACDAEEGDGDACAHLGLLRHEGAEGVPVDEAAALRRFERACTLRDRFGCRNAGIIFRDGIGTERDEAQWRRHFEQACDLGDEGACSDLGR